MNLKKRIIIKLGIIISLLVINVMAMAATPRSNCTIRARVLGLLNVTIGGRVSNNGQVCLPIGALSPLLNPLQTGVQCGGGEQIIPPAIIVSASCPN
jgi:hypothetical protein